MNTSVIVKLVIISVFENNLNIFLTDKNELPFEEVGSNTTLEQTVENIFHKITNSSIKNYYFEQLYTINNKPRTHDLIQHQINSKSDEQDIVVRGKDTSQVTIVYYLLMPPLDNLAWKRVNKIQKNIPDFSIISYAKQRLAWKIEYTNVVYSLLPQEFTLTNLQKVYEVILDKNLDKRNFRKKILSLKFLQKLKIRKIGNARPAMIYTFKDKKPITIKIFS